MNSVEKLVKKRRKERLRRLLKIRKARDLSVKQRKEYLPLSAIERFISDPDEYTFNQLAILIYDSELTIRIMDISRRGIKGPKKIK